MEKWIERVKPRIEKNRSEFNKVGQQTTIY